MNSTFLLEVLRCLAMEETMKVYHKQQEKIHFPEYMWVIIFVKQLWMVKTWVKVLVIG